MNALLRLYKIYPDKFKNLRNIIVTTDRSGLDDDNKTSIYKIKEWKKMGWHSHEGKAIKNSYLLDDIDKARRKIRNKTHCFVRIKYRPEKYNKIADRLSKAGKRRLQRKDNIAVWGIKIGKRIYEGGEVNYETLKEKEKYNIRIFKKEPVRDQWEISVEVCEGRFLGNKFKIYSDSAMQKKMHRWHYYFIMIKKVFTHHVTIYKNIKVKKGVRNLFK